jgi:RNAse (barnase) inhibitor barstar
MSPTSRTLDFALVNDQRQLHQLFFDQFDFPDYYGFNWNAMWDTITAIVAMPASIKIIHFAVFESANADEAAVFRQIVREYNQLMSGKSQMHIND